MDNRKQVIPRPQDDEKIAAISRWLQKNGYTMHVTLKGGVSFQKKGANGDVAIEPA